MSKTKNSEVSVSINGNKPFVTLVPVDYGKMNSLQSMKSKDTAKIQILLAQGNTAEVDKKIAEFGRKYQELVEPSLKEMFKGLNVTYTEVNKLMTFLDANGNVYKQLSFEIKAETEESAE